MISEAKAFWDSISGKVKSLIRKETENAMRLQRYDVTTAPNGTVMGVRQPFGNNEIFLPYSQEVASATVGDTVLVAWWGSMSNAKVYYFADGYEGTAGAGLPTGGTAGQGLLKTGPDDYQAAWGNVVTSVNGLTGAVELFESGTDGTWTWRKWSDGLLELQRFYNGPPATGSHYAVVNSFYAYYVSGLTFPSGVQPINNEYLVSADWHIGVGFALSSDAGQTKSVTGFNLYALANIQGQTTVKISIYVRGRWK